MKEFIRRYIENDAFTRVLMGVILTLLIVITVAFSAFSFLEMQESLTSQYQSSQAQSEESLTASLVLVDRGLALFDSLTDGALREGLEEFSREYEAAGRDPGEIDYAALKTRLQGSFDGTIELSVINEKGIMEYSTFEEDIGLDFKQWPEAYAALTDVRLGDAFSADRSVFGEAKVLRKFAYLPTPDHRYVLQLSLQSDEFHTIREEFSYAMALQQCIRLNPNIVDIRLFDCMGRYRCNATSEYYPTDYVPGADVAAIVDRVFATQFPHEISVPADETLIRYIYIDMPDRQCVSSRNMDLVAQITYTKCALNLAIAGQLLSHTMIALVAIGFGVLVAFGASRFVARPITMLAEDVAAISDGDLDHPIRTPGNREIRILSRNIASLVARLKDNLASVRQYSDHLEQIINDRTEQLQETNTELNRYLDLLKYSMRNASNEIQSYLNLQKASLEEGDTALLDAALATARRTDRTVATISKLRRASIFDESPHSHPIDLKKTIDETIRGHHAPVHYTGESIMVLADELLGLAIFNLIQFCNRVHEHGDISINTEEKERNVDARITLSASEQIRSPITDISDQGLSQHPELEIARLILQSYGSRLHIDLGGGTGDVLALTFTLTKTS